MLNCDIMILYTAILVGITVVLYFYVHMDGDTRGAQSRRSDSARSNLRGPCVGKNSFN